MGNVHCIKAVKKGSIAEELGISPGDALLEINGNSIEDVLEYKYMINAYYIEMLIRKINGENWLLKIQKEPYEDIGFEFKTGLMDVNKSCANNCIFCFIDQLPKGMRKSLYFKDDDVRLSFLQGNFITLTNLDASDVERIIKYRISPLNVSVHTTDPGLRSKMLKNPKAGEALNVMYTLLRKGLVLNCQIVVCPGINDGQNLEKSLKDLYDLGQGIKSIGVVPVGITGHRDGLYPIRPFSVKDAAETISIVMKWQDVFLRTHKSRVVHAADELYLKAQLRMPSVKAYEDFPQLENGIGMMALFEKQFNRLYKKTKKTENKPDIVSVATGMAAADFIKGFVKKTEEKVENKNIIVYPILNRFFGETIDVAGLVTGNDLMEQLKGKELGSKLIIPENMLRRGERVFLDDVSIDAVEKNLGTVVEVCPVEGKELFKRLVSEGLG